MIHRIGRKKYDIYAMDIESHNDEESIAKKETSMWLGCFINEDSKKNETATINVHIRVIINKNLCSFSIFNLNSFESLIKYTAKRPKIK
jgi:hypothetical protein